MQKVKILIVEDELIIAETLKLMLEDIGYEVVDIFTSGTETLKKFKNGLADIILMDIHLADKTSGIDTAMELKKNNAIPVIFLTDNQDEYLRKKAIYETNAVHYLAKPFNKKELGVALDFALKFLHVNEFNSLNTIAEPNKADEPDEKLKNGIFLKNGYGFKKVMISDILFLKASGSYSEFILKDRKQMLSENLSYFEDKLAFAKDLIRVHRSYIININFIERIHENRVWINGEEIPISKAYKNDLTEKFRFIQ